MSPRLAANTVEEKMLLQAMREHSLERLKVYPGRKPQINIAKATDAEKARAAADNAARDAWLEQENRKYLFNEVLRRGGEPAAADTLEVLFAQAVVEVRPLVTTPFNTLDAAGQQRRRGLFGDPVSDEAIVLPTTGRARRFFTELPEERKSPEEVVNAKIEARRDQLRAAGAEAIAIEQGTREYIFRDLLGHPATDPLPPVATTTDMLRQQAIRRDKFAYDLQVAARARVIRRMTKEIQDVKRKYDVDGKGVRKPDGSLLTTADVTKDITTAQSVVRKRLARKEAEHLRETNAALKIQALWRGRQARKPGGVIEKAREEAEARRVDRARREAERAADVADIMTRRGAAIRKDIDRKQLDAELKLAHGPVPVFYNKTPGAAGKFVTNPDRKSHQSKWIEGIYGHREFAMDDNGKAYDRSVAVEYKDGTPVYRVGNQINKPDNNHLGVSRSREHFGDNIMLDPSGMPVAYYSGNGCMVKLQEDLNRIRAEQEIARVNGKALLEYGETRHALVAYKEPHYDAAGRFSETTRYIMLTQNYQGLTESFVPAEVVNSKTRAASAIFDNPARYEELVVAALDRVKDVVDPAEKRERAEHMVRQEIREGVMKEIAEQAEQSRKDSKALYKLNEADLDAIANAVPTNKISNSVSLSVGTLGTDSNFRKEFKKMVTGAFSDVPDVLAVDYNGVSVQKNDAGDAAVVIFNSTDPHDQMRINIPGTSFYVVAHCAAYTGMHTTYKDGKPIEVFYEKGKVFLEDNTIRYNNGSSDEFEPLCVHTSYLGINPRNTLANHDAAKRQGGYKGYEGIREKFDNFAVKVCSNIEGNRSIALKAPGKEGAVVTVALDPVAHKDKADEQIKFSRTIPTPEAIRARNKASDILDPKFSQWNPAEIYAKSTAIYLGDETRDPKTPGAKIDAKQEDKTAKDISNRIAAEYGEIFVQVRRVEEDERRPKRFSAVKDGVASIEEAVIENPDLGKHVEGDYYQRKEPYVYDEASGTYKQLDKKDVIALLAAQGVQDEEAKKYVDRLFARFRDVNVRECLVDDQFAQVEEELRFYAATGNLDGVQKILKMYNDIKIAIDAKYDYRPGSPDAEKCQAAREAAYKSMNFNLNAVGLTNGRSALHMAVKNGHEHIVAALLEVGQVKVGDKVIKSGDVDSGVKDKKGRTALDLARKEGHADIKKRIEVKSLEEKAEELGKKAEKLDEACGKLKIPPTAAKGLGGQKGFGKHNAPLLPAKVLEWAEKSAARAEAKRGRKTAALPTLPTPVPHPDPDRSSVLDPAGVKIKPSARKTGWAATAAVQRTITVGGGPRT